MARLDPESEVSSELFDKTSLFIGTCRKLVLDETKSFFEEVKFPNIAENEHKDV